MPEQPNITNIPSARVEIIDSRTGMISREWYRFFLNLFNLAGNGGNQTSLDDLQLGPPPSADTTSSGGSGTVTSVDVSGGTTGLTTTGGPITTSGTITLAGTLAVANGGSGTATPALVAGTNVTITGSWPNQTINSSNPGGTVTAVSVTSANGFAGSSSGGATPALTLSTSITGVLKGDGTALSAATSGTDYSAGTSALTTGILKSTTTTGALSIAVAADFPTLNQNTTGSAATLTTGRTIAITGDMAYTSPSFDGSTNVTAAGTLATVNTNVGSFTNASITVNGKGLVTAASSGTAPVTSVTGTSPVVSSGGATPAISLATAYGDTLNPYASKTANFILAAPDGSAGVPTFRAVVATDIPTLNQNTTGTASNVTGTVAIANGGTGQTTAAAAFNALSPITSTGDLIIGNGANSATRLAIGATSYVLTSNGTTATWAAAAGGGSNITALGLWENNASITANYTIGTGNNATSAGPISVAASIVVTVPTGSTWVVL
jgi:hypothetical protein